MRPVDPVPPFEVHLDVPWPGRPDVRLAELAVGPSGVWLVLRRAWSALRSADGRVLAGEDDVTEQVAEFGSFGQQMAADLARLGLLPSEVHVLLVLPVVADRIVVAGVQVVAPDELAQVLAAPGRLLRAAQVARVDARLRQLFGVTERRPAADPLVEPDPWSAAEHALAGRRAAPAWVAMLDPPQAAAAWRHYSGPVRIRGAAGTGTSVVAVHRAVHLARAGDAVALVAPTTELVMQLRARVDLLGGPDLKDGVVVATPAQLARAVLADNGMVVRDEPAVVAEAWVAAQVDAGATGAVGDIGADEAHDEVVQVIRGRGLTDQSQYDALRPDLPVGLRLQIWQLAQAYARELVRHTVPDGQDMVRMATTALAVDAVPADGASAGFRAVVVDDAADLTLTELRFVHALVGDGADALTLLDDGLPGLSPVVATLPEAGIDIGQRCVTLEQGRRLGTSTWEYVLDLLRTDGAPDLAGRHERPPLVGVRQGSGQGAAPECVRSAIERLRRAKVIAHLQQLVAGGVAPSDMALLVMAGEPDPELVADLAVAGLAVTGLTGRGRGAVRLGTVRQARGLAFDHVVVVDVPHRVLVDEPQAAQWDRPVLRRRLALAATRARRSVWIGSV